MADPKAATLQSEIVAFLSAGASYGAPGGAVQRVETHGSEIFLIGERAYKLKRPVAFSALDYRTLARREAACRAEVALNRRTAPELYLGLRAIRRRADGGLGFDGEGKLLDWVVEMWRFDQADLLDAQADFGLLGAGLMRDLADEIAGFHELAEPTPGFGGAAGLGRAIERNQADFATVGRILDLEAVRALQSKSAAALRDIGDLLDRRAQTGKVRRCHGDLRLANICLVNGRPTLFDGIEFSEAISCIDVLYDLSFLLMDLGSRRLGHFANIVLNRYLDHAGDGDTLAALPLMLSVRAATRAFGLALGAKRRAGRPHEAQALAASAGQHLALATKLLEKRAARLVVLGGLSGSGKSALAYGLGAGLAPMPGARVLAAEVVERRLLGLAPDARIPATSRTGELAAGVQAALMQEATGAVRASRSAVLDAPLMRDVDRAELRAFAASEGMPFFGLWVGPLEELGEAERPGWHVFGRGGDLAALLAHARSLVDAAPLGAVR